MYNKPSVPRTIGGVLDDSLQLYKNSLSSCWLPSLLASVVIAALSYYLMSATQGVATSAGSAASLVWLGQMMRAAAPWYLVVMIVNLTLYGMVVANICAISRGEVPTFGASFAKGLRRMPAFFVASFVFLIVIFIASILLVIPGIYLWNRLQLYMVPLVDESKGPFESLGASWHAVGGNWWRTAVVVFVMFVILGVLEIVLSAVAGVIAGVAGAGSGITSNPLLLVGRVQLVTLIISTILRVVTMPLILAMFVALYQDLTLRKGGADLEARLGALPRG